MNGASKAYPADLSVDFTKLSERFLFPGTFSSARCRVCPIDPGKRVISPAQAGHRFRSSGSMCRQAEPPFCAHSCAFARSCARSRTAPSPRDQPPMRCRSRCHLYRPRNLRPLFRPVASSALCTSVLLTSSSSVVLVRNGRLLLLPTPYRDAHGEVDLGLQRGKPLSLDEHEYLGLTRKWLAMSFDDTAKGDEADQMF